MDEAELSSGLGAADVVLRPYQPDDAQAIYDLTQEPAVLRFLPDWNVPLAQRHQWLWQYELPENERFLAAVARGQPLGDLRLRLGIVERRHGQFAGWCCTGIKPDLPSPNREVVYAVADRFRGRGYATQAVTALVDYLLSQTEVTAVSGVAHHGNAPSQRVLQQSGMQFVGTLDIDGAPHHHYRRSR